MFYVSIAPASVLKTLSWQQSINFSLITLSDLKFWQCRSDARKQTCLCTRTCAHTLNVSSAQPEATAEMSQRGSPFRMLLAVLFQSLWSCPFQCYPSSHATAPGKEQQSLLWVLLHCLFHPLRRKNGYFSSLFVFAFCQPLLDAVNQAQFWFAQPEFSSCRRHLAFTANKQCFYPWMIWVRDEHINHHPSNIFAGWLCWFGLVLQKLNQCQSGLDLAHADTPWLAHSVLSLSVTTALNIKRNRLNLWALTALTNCD